MALSAQEQFQVLLQQLNYENMPQSFQGATLEKLIVHKKSRVWQFNFSFTALPPVSDFADLINRMQTSFSAIAQTTFQVTLANQPDLPQVANYWSWVLQQCQQHSGAFQSAFSQVMPQVEQDRLVLVFENEAWANYARQTGMPLINQAYHQLGLTYDLPVEIEVDQQKAAESEAQMAMDRAQQEQQMAEQAKAQLEQAQQTRKQNNNAKAPKANSDRALGRKIGADVAPTPMIEIEDEERSVVVEGYIFSSEVRELKSGRQLITMKVTDYTSSFILKKFSRDESDEAFFEKLKVGTWIKARGPIQQDDFVRDLTMNAYDIELIHHENRQELYQGDQKRVELHTHSLMSTMDATNSIGDFVKQAAEWGMDAIAITDTAGAQGFPEAASSAAKYGLKMIYGVEVNLVEDGDPIVLNPQHRLLDGAEYVVFDIETTGLSAAYDRIIELSAVKMQKGNVIAEFSEFIDPGFSLSETTVNLTSITDADVQGSKSEEQVLKEFREFYGDDILVGHNVTFDVDFVNEAYNRHGMEIIENPVIDTLPLARFLYPNMRSYRLNTLAKHFNVNLEHHHRAIYDAETTGHLNQIFLAQANEEYGIEYADQLNDHMTDNDAWRHGRPNKAVLLVQHQQGVKNLYKLISASNTDYFYRVPRVPKSLLTKYRDGLLVGTGDTSGEFWEALMQKGVAEATRKAKDYDYIEIHPSANYEAAIEGELIQDEARLRELMQQAVEIGKKLDKPVVVTGDVHYLNPEDAIYRKVLISSQGGANPLNRYSLPDLHFRTTQEVLDDFAWMGEEQAKELVIDNPHKIVDMIDDVEAIKTGNYPPNMPTAEEEIRQRTYDTAHKMYGNPLPLMIEARIEQELKSIISNGFSVIYLVAQRLVAKSNKDGYLVGSRGSVGSSLVALLIGVTEVNALAPHYRSQNGDYVEFVDPRQYESGYDVPEKMSPIDGTKLMGDGHNIPFETFLGFKGNKVPDIDLNFSGDYQPYAHNYMKSLFGENNVFRAGTIATVADKTAYGYAKAYERENELHLRGAEVDRLAAGATGVKRTTGQHPAGILIVPDDMEIYDFTPIQYPADDMSATWKTTHFDFHSIHDNILKMDILGHDDPTMIRALQDMSGIDPHTIPMDDPGVMSLFSSPEVLGVTEEQIMSKTGTLGVPEFGTAFVRGMLEETHPKNYSELLQISGLSHGTDVWRGNADELIKDGVADIGTVIGTRDKIMTDLINYGVQPESAFQIMEKVRKGKGISEEYQAEMREAGVPEWYIESCFKIKYMFPRAHAAAYVLMALRIAYYKVYFPMLYYCAYFSVRATNFDIVAMSRGLNSTKSKIQEIKQQGNDASAKDKDLLTVLELANEALERGIDFGMVDLYKSDSEQWIIEGNTLIAPFNSVPGLGDNVAKRIVAARAEGEFLSKEDLAERGGVSKSLMDFFEENGVLDGMPDENQLALF
ncbi:DNA polymerase-3 subunit alpha (Gram-positive type) [Weissella uvarum]|uniref:PolC-type DNA polymerase III n=1 Tax=Weissella uvarum TaxID=1479233 RepID=UPI00195FDC33|nr:PolC-type DNA polymerase III [Weissella uvarum]MBM7617718.1 DNA polymerase-3 subunit alpha (Gram-positive type) [Weissella uvarum]MCM0596068.1 PolC-type DNA polymerase III [Weissella uvarum]